MKVMPQARDVVGWLGNLGFDLFLDSRPGAHDRGRSRLIPCSCRRGACKILRCQAGARQRGLASRGLDFAGKVLSVAKWRFYEPFRVLSTPEYRGDVLSWGERVGWFFRNGLTVHQVSVV